MADDGISADLREFIARSIDSVGQLEALLLLRNNADRGWGVPDLARRLYVSESEAAAIFAHLVSQDLVDELSGEYRYARDTRHAPLVEQLAAAYTRQLIPITNLIHAKPHRIRAFADAFKLKRDKP